MGGSTTDAYDDPHHAAAAAFVCDRHAAATQPGHHDDGHHNYQLPLLALTLVLVSGGLIQHFFSGVPLPYTVLLLLFGMALGAWVETDGTPFSTPTSSPEPTGRHGAGREMSV